MPVDMRSSSAMGASRPTGSISDVTTQKVLRPAAATAGQSARSGTAGMAAADAGAAVVAVVAECMSDRWKKQRRGKAEPVGL